MKERVATDVLVSVMARLYEQVFLLDRNGSGGSLIREGKSFEISDYDSWCVQEFTPVYEGDDISVFLQKISLAKILAVLTYEDQYVIDFSQKEQEEVSRKRLKAFECREKEMICICIEDMTDQYETEKRREQIAKESVEIAQQAEFAKLHFFKEMNDALRWPAAQADEMLRAAQQALDPQEYIEKARKVLGKYEQTLEEMFAVSVMENGEDFEWDRVIFTKKFAGEILHLAQIQESGTQYTVKLGENTEKIVGFIADEPRLKQMLAGAASALAKCSGKCMAEAVLDFDIRSGTDMDEPVFDLVYTVSAEDIKEDVCAHLSYVQRLVDYMDGILRVENAENGMEIRIRIPVQRADRNQLKEAQKMTRLTDALTDGDFSAFRALVVDDDEISCAITASKLKQYGLTVETAGDGEEAREKLLASPGRYYQIIFMKMYLPKKSGLELTMELREMNRRDLNDITIVALTANPLRDKRIVALEHGMDHHLVLPFNEVELKEILIRELQDMGPGDEPEKFGFRVLK